MLTFLTCDLWVTTPSKHLLLVVSAWGTARRMTCCGHGGRVDAVLLTCDRSHQRGAPRSPLLVAVVSGTWTPSLAKP